MSLCLNLDSATKPSAGPWYQASGSLRKILTVAKKFVQPEGCPWKSCTLFVALVPSCTRMLHFQFGWDKFSKNVLICISPILNDSNQFWLPNYAGLEFENPRAVVQQCTAGTDPSAPGAARQAVGTEVPRQSSAVSSLIVLPQCVLQLWSFPRWAMRWKRTGSCAWGK